MELRQRSQEPAAEPRSFGVVHRVLGLAPGRTRHDHRNDLLVGRRRPGLGGREDRAQGRLVHVAIPPPANRPGVQDEVERGVPRGRRPGLDLSGGWVREPTTTTTTRSFRGDDHGEAIAVPAPGLTATADRRCPGGGEGQDMGWPYSPRSARARVWLTVNQTVLGPRSLSLDSVSGADRQLWGEWTTHYQQTDAQAAAELVHGPAGRSRRSASRRSSPTAVGAAAFTVHAGFSIETVSPAWGIGLCVASLAVSGLYLVLLAG